MSFVVKLPTPRRCDAFTVGKNVLFEDADGVQVHHFQESAATVFRLPAHIEVAPWIWVVDANQIPEALVVVVAVSFTGRTRIFLGTAFPVIHLRVTLNVFSFEVVKTSGVFCSKCGDGLQRRNTIGTVNALLFLTFANGTVRRDVFARAMLVLNRARLLRRTGVWY